MSQWSKWTAEPVTSAEKVAAPSKLGRLGWLLPPVMAFGVSRLIVIGVLYVGPVLNPAFRHSSFFLDYDGAHYLYIAGHGYPPLYPPEGGYLAYSAFFPLLPWLTRWLSYVTHLPLETSAFLIVTAAGLGACVGIWWLALETLGDREAAGRTVMLALIWPASFVLSMNYSEGLLIVSAAWCLLALRRQRWVWAGVAGLLASLARPDGVVLAVSCAWCAFVAIRATGSWRPLIAPLLAPLGMVGYFTFLAVRLDDPFLWFKAEKRGWGVGFDFGQTFVSNIGEAVRHPMGQFDLVPSSLAGIVGILLVLWACRERLPTEQILYAVGILVLTLGSGFGGSIPRFVMHAFPLFTAPGKRLSQCSPWALAAWSAISTAGFVCLMLVVTTTRRMVP